MIIYPAQFKENPGMTIDLATLSLDEKRERVLRYASGWGAAVVPMDEPELSKKLAEYVRWDDSEERVDDNLPWGFGGKPRQPQWARIAMGLNDLIRQYSAEFTEEPNRKRQYGTAPGIMFQMKSAIHFSWVWPLWAP